MGAKHQRSIAYNQQTAAQAQSEIATEQRNSNERAFGAANQMLGSDEQVAGYGVDQRMEAYTGRYSVDAGTVSSLQSSHKNNMRNANFASNFDTTANEANSLMQQAQDAAQAGNWEEAERLRMAAQNSLGKIGGQAYESAFRMGGASASTRAKGILSGPQAQIVGGQVKQAREFQDWGSQGSQDWRARMAESGERSIAAEAQSALRGARDFGLQRGSARSASAAAAMQSETLRRASTERAQVHSAVNQAFESFRHEFAQGAVNFATSWLQQQSGVREEFNNAQMNLSGMTAELFGQGSELATKFAAMAQQDKEAGASKRGALYGAGLKIGAGLLGFVVGGPAGAAAGMSVASAVGGK